jgi:carboxylesterase type B
MTSDSGKTIRAFTGIPYAAPPVGDLRFKPPQKVEPWLKKTKRLMEDPPSCTQINLFDTIPNVNPRAEVTGQEDCLYLNVYTPEV